MSTHRPVFFSLLALLAAMTIPSAVAAQGEGTSLCPAYGQAVATVTIMPLPANKVAAGASVPVTIRLTNLENHPFSQSALLMRLVATGTSDQGLTDMNGAVFGRSVPLDDIFLAERGSRDFTLSLDIPSSLPSGEYAIEATFVPSDFDFDNVEAGLSRSGKANAGYVPITIDGQTEKGFAYLSSQDASFIEAEDGTVTVSVEVVNAAPRTVDVPLLWKVYSWNAVDEKAVVSSEVVTVRVPASGKVKALYPLNATERSLYMVVAEAVSRDLHTFAVVRAADLRGEAAVRMLGLAPEGSSMKAFACVYNVFFDDEEKRTLSLAATDGSGTALGDGSFTITTGMTDAEFAVPLEIKGSGDVILTASVFSSRGLEKQLEKVFRCTDLGTCAVPSSEEPSDLGLIFSVTLLSAGIGGILAILCLKRRRRRKFIAYTS